MTDVRLARSSIEVRKQSVLCHFRIIPRIAGYDGIGACLKTARFQWLHVSAFRSICRCQNSVARRVRHLPEPVGVSRPNSFCAKSAIILHQAGRCAVDDKNAHPVHSGYDSPSKSVRVKGAQRPSTDLDSHFLLRSAQNIRSCASKLAITLQATLGKRFSVNQSLTLHGYSSCFMEVQG